MKYSNFIKSKCYGGKVAVFLLSFFTSTAHSLKTKLMVKRKKEIQGVPSQGTLILSPPQVSLFLATSILSSKALI